MELVKTFLYYFRPSRLFKDFKRGYFFGFNNQISFIRYVWFARLLKRLSIDPNLEGVGGFEYSRDTFSKFTPLDRIYFPIFALSSIPELSKDDLLIIGPRYENEIYVCAALGFEVKKISLIDSITYSPKISAGNMHAMPFKSEKFSSVICSWTLSYSTNPKNAAEEIQRVSRTGGFIVISVDKVDFKNQKPAVEGLLAGSARIQTVNQIQALFTSCKVVMSFEPKTEGMLVCVLQKV